MNALKVTVHDIACTKVSVWHPENINDGYSISMTEGGWLCGTYDSIESALIGAKFDLDLNASFYNMQKEVNHFDKGNRLIALSDLEGL